MDDQTKRFYLFIFGCIGTRLAITYGAYRTSIEHLPILGYIALIPAFGMLYYYVSGTRKTGPEVFGGKIWWDKFRPLHVGLLLTFSYLAINKNKKAWIALLIDALLGLFLFTLHRYEIV
jgi:hypothetical protein